MGFGLQSEITSSFSVFQSTTVSDNGICTLPFGRLMTVENRTSMYKPRNKLLDFPMQYKLLYLRSGIP